MKRNLSKFWKESSLSQKIIYIIFILSFLVATTTHIRDQITGGFLPYKSFPLWANIYWTVLTLADPAAVGLLLWRLKPGVFFYGLIIVSDVAINLTFTVIRTGLPGILNLFMVCQILFLLFYLISFRLLLRDRKKYKYKDFAIQRIKRIEDGGKR